MTDLRPLPPKLVLYDGHCGLCDRTVQFLLDHDRARVLHFAPLQGETARTLRERHASVLDGVDSVVYVSRDGDREQVWVRSRAVFELAGELHGPWRALRVLGVLPRALTDVGYDLVASVRYRLFGRLDQCRVPRPEERARFLP